jgi:hypothetical protein
VSSAFRLIPFAANTPVGSIAWRYHLVFVKPSLSVASPTYWFMMQIGMIIGVFTAWPANTWLIRTGWKEKM